MKFVLTLVVAGLFIQGLIGQEEIELRGKVLNDTIDRAALSVVNISLKTGSITNNKGEFTISARLNDTINISAIQYEPRQFVVNQTIFNRKRISLYLAPKVTELGEVKISNIDLSGNLNTDAVNTKVNPVLTPQAIGLPGNTAKPRTIEERRLYEATSSSTGIPINLILNAISGRLKILKRNVKVSNFARKVREARATFSDSIYNQQLNVPKPLIEDFVYYIFEQEEAEEFVNNEDALGLLEYMMQQSDTYLELKKKEGQ